MPNPVLIVEVSCSDEFSEGGDYIVAEITKELRDSLEAWQKIVKTLPAETTEIRFRWWDFELVDYPTDEGKFAQIVEDPDDPDHIKNGYSIVEAPLETLDIGEPRSADLHEVGFIPGTSFDEEFRFKCHMKNSEAEFTSRPIKIQDVLLAKW